MKNFTDNSGRTWTIALNVDALKRVRSLCDVNLMAAVEGKLVERLVSDPVLLCDVLYAICSEEAEKRSISTEDFGRSLAGDAIDAGTTALLEELVDFFPKRRREVLRKALEKLDSLEAKSINAAMIFIQSPELDRRVDEAVKSVFAKAGIDPAAPDTESSAPAPNSGPSSTNSPDASA